MKTRILSMILVVVMLTLTLVGCAYNYDKDTDKYASINKDAFAAALLSLKIDDADFGTDEAKRWTKVEDSILEALASLVEGDDQGKTSGAIDENDVVYYCFYATLADGTQVYTSSMLKSSSDSVKIQLNLTANEGRDKAIETALLALEGEFKEFKTLDADGVAAEGQLALVTYTVKGDGTTENPDVKYENQIITLPAAAAEGAHPDSLAQYLVGQKVGTLEQKEIAGKTYTGITLTQVISESTKVVATYTYTEKTEVGYVGQKNKDDKVDLKDKALTINVFPVKVDKVGGYNASVILKDLLGADGITAGEVGNEDAKGTLPIFTNNDYKNGEKTMNTLVTELVGLFKTLTEAESALADAEEDLEAAKEADKKNSTPTTQAEVTEAQGVVTTKETEKNTAETNVNNKISEIVTANGGAAEAEIVKQFKQYVYDNLEASYENTIVNKLAKAIYDAALANIAYTDELPKKAVKEAKELIYNNYEYNYYEGSTTQNGTNVKNYDVYKDNGGLNAFMAKELGTEASKADIDAAITAKAETAVKDKLVVYALKDVCEQIFPDVDFDVTKEDKDEYKRTSQKYYNMLLYMYIYAGTQDVEESHYLAAIQLDKILDIILEKGTTGEDNRVVISSDKIKYEIK